LLLLCLVVALVNGSTVWVSTTGSDSNPGTQGQPVQTVPHALTLLRSFGPSGQNTIFVQGGSYGYNNVMSLSPINVNIVATGGTVVFSCNDNSGPFVSWGTSTANYWYTVQFKGIVFEGCNGELIALNVYASNGGGMNFVFSSVDFDGSTVYFVCNDGSANCNITMTGVNFSNMDSTALVVSEAIGVSIQSASFTGVDSAILLSTVDTVSLTDSGFSDCYSSSALFEFMQCSNVYLGNSQISSNQFADSLILVDACGNFSMYDVQLNNNSGVVGDEAVLFNAISSTVVLDNIGVSGNTADIIVQFYSTSAYLNDVGVQDNKASLYTIYIDGTSSLSMTNTQILNNVAANGGAVSVFGGALEASYCTFSGNTVTGDGGALYAISGMVSLSDVTVSNNMAETGGAGYCVNTEFSDEECNYENNTSEDGSAPLQC